MVKKILKTKKQIKKYKGGAGRVLHTCRTFTNYIQNIKNLKNFKNLTEALEKELEILITKKTGEIIINSNSQLPTPKTYSGLIKSIIKKSITDLLNKPSNNKIIKNISLSTFNKTNKNLNETNLNENNLFNNFTINKDYLETYFNTYIKQLENNNSNSKTLKNLSKKITNQQTETIELSNNNLKKLFKIKPIPIPDIQLNELFKPNCSIVI